MTEPNAAPSPPGAPDGRYLAVVGALLLIILAVLASLWVRESRRRRAAERELARLRSRSDRLHSALGEALAAQFHQQGALRREELPAETVVLDGKPAVALRLGAAAAERLGFRPGDVILVAQTRPAVATTTATAPGD